MLSRSRFGAVVELLRSRQARLARLMAIGYSAWELRSTAPHTLGGPVLDELRRAVTPIHLSKLLRSKSENRVQQADVISVGTSLLFCTKSSCAVRPTGTWCEARICHLKFSIYIAIITFMTCPDMLPGLLE